MSELRHDPLTDRWVVISPERGARPRDSSHSAIAKSPGFCPFCPGSEDKTPVPEIFALLKDGRMRQGVSDQNLIRPDWEVRVIPNKFSILRIEVPLKSRGIGVFDWMSGFGAHEIIIESPNHDSDTAFMEVNDIWKILMVIKGRMEDLARDSRFRYLLLFKNRGGKAGASLEHPHWQLNGLPITPTEVAIELQSSKDHYNNKGRCLICDILTQELESGTRIVESDEQFVVWSPFAARYPAELFIAPIPDSGHNHDFTKSDKETIGYLALAMQRTMKRIVRKYTDVAYNIVLHTSPLFNRKRENHGGSIAEDYHWHFHIYPRGISEIAGLEIGSGCFVNILSPEDVAKTLRETAI